MLIYKFDTEPHAVILRGPIPCDWLDLGGETEDMPTPPGPGFWVWVDEGSRPVGDNDEGEIDMHWRGRWRRPTPEDMDGCQGWPAAPEPAPLVDDRRMPLQLDRRHEVGLPTSVPWSLVAPHEAQARLNHGGQSLARLAERGGLGVIELYAIVHDRWLRDCSFADARDWLRRWAAAQDGAGA